MSETFTASNGITMWLGLIEVGASAAAFQVDLAFPTGKLVSVDDFFKAMHEWMQHRRDQELGRWRDPEAPDKVVYHLPSAKREATGRTVRVLDERLGATVICNEHLERSSDPTNAEPSAARYFAAHPEPKPWQDAKPGEVWVLKIEGVPAAIPATVDRSPEFRTVLGDYFSLDDPRITSGQKIWPTGNPQQDPVESATRKESDDE